MFVTLPNNSDAIITFKVKLLHTGLPKKCYLLTTSVHACLPTYHVWLLEGFWNHRQSYKCLSHVNKNRLALPLFKSQRHQKQWLSFYDLKKVSNISFIKIHSIKYPETISFLTNNSYEVNRFLKQKISPVNVTESTASCGFCHISEAVARNCFLKKVFIHMLLPQYSTASSP